MNATAAPKKTKKGILLNQRCSGTIKACYYKDGNYPSFPTNPDKVINDYMTTEFDSWLHKMENVRPDRVYNYMLT